jgi:carbon monoxide dehydrogenase subunit G
MSSISVDVTIPAAPDVVWKDLSDIPSHVEWMHDAVAIRFTSASRSGVGTTFDCDTKVGPIKLTDRMEITEWEDGRTMGVRHVGAVTGTGRFELTPDGADRTRFSWTERLEFPWWLAGPVGAWLAKPVLGFIWRRNLRALAARFGPV